MEFLVFDVNLDEWDWQRQPAPAAPDTAPEAPLDLVLAAALMAPMAAPLLLLAQAPAPMSLSQMLSPKYRYTQSFTFSPSPKMALLALLLVAALDSAVDVVADSLPAPTLVHRHSEPISPAEATVDPKDLFGGTNMASLGAWGAPALAALAALVLLERGRSQLLGLLPLDFSTFDFDLTAPVTVRDAGADVLPLAEAADAPVPEVVPVLASDTLSGAAPLGDVSQLLALLMMAMAPMALMPPLQVPPPAPAPPAPLHSAPEPPAAATADSPQPPPRKRAKLEATALASLPQQMGQEDIVYPCRECAKVFKRLEHLKRHVRLVHLDIRPFHCNYCEKKFSRLDNLAQHTKTHLRTDADGNTLVVYGNPNSRKRKLTSG